MAYGGVELYGENYRGRIFYNRIGVTGLSHIETRVKILQANYHPLMESEVLFWAFYYGLWRISLPIC